MPYYAPMNPAAGNSTGIADSFGNHWNNAWMNEIVPGATVPPTLVNLVTSTNLETCINLSFSDGWGSNGLGNGGLSAPSPALLGDFASENATMDSYWVDGMFMEDQIGIASMTFSNLNPLLTYNFKIFATRALDEVRRTEYLITDINGTHSTILQTSGAGIGEGGYNGNNNTFAYLTGIVPDASGTITRTLKPHTGSYAYISALQITAVPEPTAFGIAAAAGCLAFVAIRRLRETERGRRGLS